MKLSDMFKMVDIIKIEILDIDVIIPGVVEHYKFPGCVASLSYLLRKILS